MTRCDELPTDLVDYVAARADDWSQSTRRSSTSSIAAFHRWLVHRGIAVDDLTPEILEQYLERPCGQRLSLLSRKNYALQIRNYLFWLHAEQRTTLDLSRFWPKRAARAPNQIPAIIADFCAARATAWSPRTIDNSRWLLVAFYRWLADEGLSLADLTLAVVIRFADAPGGKPVSRKSARVHIRIVRRYLSWMHAEGRSDLDPRRLWPAMKNWVRRKSTPLVQEFLDHAAFPRSYKSKARYQSVVNHFHEWLAARGGELDDLSSQHQREFMLYLADQGYAPTNLYKSGHCLRVYFRWLRDAKGVRITDADATRDFKVPSTRYTEQLPPYAKRFIEVIAANAREKTVVNYRNAVCHLHLFVDRRGIAIEAFRRSDAEDWMIDLKKSGASPMWRRQLIYNARTYLTWLHENGLVIELPDHLLRREDLPRLPKYLPRPLPAEIDRTLLERLDGADDAVRLGLLVLRLTGIRVGELLSLPANCTHRDLEGHTLLKVPLGKLDSERLVPLEPKAVDAIDALRHLARIHISAAGAGVEPEFLVYLPGGRRPERKDFRVALHDVCKDLVMAEPITVHRLRHTYATALLNGGMSLISVMKLLGHRSLRMTLQYATIAPDTIRDEYFAALAKLESRYQLRQCAERDDEPASPVEAFSDVIAWLKKSTPSRRRQRKHELLIKRLHRLRAEIEESFLDSDAGC